MMKLGICISTCYPNRAFQNIFNAKSLDEIDNLADCAVLLLNLQRYSKEDIRRLNLLLAERKIGARYRQNEYSGAPNVPINKIRADCANLMDCDYYLILDDDMNLFTKNGISAADEIRMAIKYMDEFEDCGIISFRTRPPRVPVEVSSTEKGVIAPMPWNARYNTANGIMLRNLTDVTSFGKIFPNDTLDLVGGGEEKILAGYQLSNGFYGACIQKVSSKNARCKHELSMCWDNREQLLSNNDGYIKHHWNEDFEGFHAYNIVKYEDYLKAGGKDIFANTSKYTRKYF